MIKKVGYYVRYIFGLTRDKILSFRMLIAVLVLFVFHDNYIRELAELTSEYQVKVVPFVLSFLCNEMAFTLIFGFCVLYVFSGTPYMNSREMYFIARSGRIKWGLAQSASVFLTSVIFVVVNFIIDIIRLFPNITFENEWDKLSFTLAFGSIEPNSVGFDMNVLVDYSPYNIAIYSFCMSVLVVNMIGQLMYAVSLLANRTVAVLIGAVISIMSIVANNTANMYSAVYFLSPISWISRSKNVFALKLPDEKYMFLAAIIVWLLCIITVMFRVRTVDFDWKEEE